jgi:ParB family chromosome partitioning protein
VSKNRRGGLGRGLGALIPTAPAAGVATAVEEPPSVNGHGPVGEPADAPEVPAQGAPEPAEAPEGAEAEAPPTPAGDEAAEPDGPLPVPGARLVDVPVEQVRPNPRQPRQVFDEDALAELTHSVREFGVLQPVVVRDAGDGYELIMGERRLRAAQAAGLASIPAIVRDTEDDAMLRDALLENIHRASLNPLEEAAAYQQLLEEFGATHEELASRIGRSRPQISNTIRLLNLPVPVQRRVAAGVLTAGHARALLGLEDREQQEELAARIVAEGLSVRATEELVALAAAGHDRGPARRAPRRTFTAPAVAELANKLSDAFDTRVKVDLGRRKGRITVEFASIDDLERIIGLMAPEVSAQAGRRGRPASDETP